MFNEKNNPFISLVLNLSNSDLNLLNEDLINFVTDIYELTFINIQILILHDSLNETSLNKTLILSFKNRRIENFTLENKEWSKNFYDFAKLIKGKFLILINKLIKVKYSEFYKIYNITKGSTENIFKLKYQDKHIIHLIRTKILRNILDSENKFQNFRDVINFINNHSIPNVNYIPIAFCPNNFYSSLTYTSMISILTSKGYYTYISFYLIIPLDFSISNIRLIESLYEQFEYFNITFISMDNRYEKAYTNRYLTKNAFFRLSLGELLPNLNKVIYLDSDTICFKDLSQLYNLNFFGKIFLAKIINTESENNKLNVNTGVLLLNLYAMRKLKIEEKVLTLLNNGFKDPHYHDQAIINIFFQKYVGFLPPEYNVFYPSINRIKEYKKDYGGLYDFDSLYFWFKYPSIKHYVGQPDSKTYNQEDWYYFARKSKYFQKRSNNFSNIFNYSLLQK